MQRELRLSKSLSLLWATRAVDDQTGVGVSVLSYPLPFLLLPGSLFVKCQQSRVGVSVGVSVLN